MYTRSAESEGENRGPELKEEDDEKLCYPDEDEPELAPFWICRGGAETDGHDCRFVVSNTFVMQIF